MIEFLVEVNGVVYEINELITEVSYKDVLNDGCSKLEFTYVNEDLIIANGCAVRFKYEDDSIFYGYVFKVSRNKGKEISVTAYDQLRYCKAKDTIEVKGDTVTTLVNKMCDYFRLTKGELADSDHVLPISIQDSKTWLDIIYNAISDTLMYKGKKYCLRDEFGSICLWDIEDLQLNLILGDESLAYDYTYKKSIDDEFYNLIKLASDNETTGKRDTYITKDSGSISKYGLLQYFETLDKNYNSAQAKSRADMLLSLFNREVETLNLECLGDTSIRAGSSFYVFIADIGLNKRLIVKEVTHKFLPIHTMSVEVSI